MLSINTIVVPQGAEYQSVCRGLSKARVNDVEIIAIPIGVKFVDRLLADYKNKLQNSEGVLIIGLGGSLIDAYSAGDSVIVNACQDLNGKIVELDPKLTTKIQQKLGIASVAGLTSDRVITQASEKLTLARTHQASIVEMEGFGYATQLQQRGIPVAMLRVISDDVHHNLPNLNRAIDSQGNLKTLPMAIALIKQPIAAINLIKGSLAGLKALKQITTNLFSV